MVSIRAVLNGAKGKSRVPDRKDMIAALGLPPEGKTRGSKYDFTTAEYWKKIRTSDSPAARSARAILAAQYG